MTEIFRKIKAFLFTNQSVKQTVAKNTFWLTFGQFGGRLLRSIIIIYSARILGVSGWGTFSYAVGLTAFLTTFIDLGISAILTRETVRSTAPEQKSKILSTAFFLKLSLLALGVIVVIFVAPHFTSIKEAIPLYPLIALILVFDTMREFGFSLNRAMEKMEWEAGLYIFTNIAIVIFGFIFLRFRPSVEYFTLSYAVGTGLGMAATFYVLRKHFKNLISNFSARLLKPILTSAWPFAVSSVLGSLTLNTDLLIIGFYTTAEQVGFYSAAQRPIQIIYLLPSILAVSIFPTLSRLAGRDNERMRSVIERIVSISFLIAIPVSIGGILLAPAIIGMLFGNAYLPATLSFQILMATVLINFPTTILSNAIFAYDKQRILVNFVAIGGITNAVFDLVFIPKFGIAGSAAVTLGSQFLSNVYLWRKVRQVSPFKILPYLKRIIVSTALMGVVVELLTIARVNAIITIGIGAVAYLGILYFSREPLLKEFKTIFDSQ